MSFDQLQTGTVLRSTYLWARQATAGETEGRKDRPVAVGVRLARKSGDLILFFPITSKEPEASRFGAEIPPIEKRRASLDVDMRPWSGRRCATRLQFFNRQITARAKVDQVVQHLMTAPGVGVIVAMAYSAVIDDPGRREHSASVGAHVGLIPRRYQSGATDISGNISKCGDELLRGYLFEAATVLLQRYVKPTMLKAWGQSLAKRIGMRRAKVAVARKLAVILHLIQTDNTTFQPGDTVAA